MSQDSYTASQCAQLLGLSTKRVRQLVENGTLKAVPRSKPLRIKAESVHNERSRRAENETLKPALNTSSLIDVLTQIEEARQAGYTQALEHTQKQITAIEHSEANTKEELYKAQAERKALYEELLEAKVRLATLEAQAERKGFFRR
jgi:chromosome segregation ATPase